MLTAKQFRDKYLGYAIDVDGAAGVQCVDLFKQCCYLAGKKAFALGGSGYADEIVHRFNALGLGEYFNLVSLSNAQYGDWIIWDKNSRECPDSHVAMFVGWNGSKVQVLGQNQFGQKKATEGPIHTDGIIGVLRLKEWIQVPVKPSGSLKYGVGTKVCVQKLSRSGDGSAGVVASHYEGTITNVYPGQPYPYRLDEDAGFVNDDIIDSDPHTPGGTTSTPKPKKLYLPSSATSWNVYPLDKAPVAGNQCAKLNPSQFGGLTYDILGYPQTDVVTIQTRDFGKVNIYVHPSTGAVIK